MVSLRDFQDEKCDIILKYFPEEVKQLKNLKEIPEVNNQLKHIIEYLSKRGSG